MRIYEQAISVSDWILSPFYIVLIFMIVVLIKDKKKHQYPYYKYFVPGIMIKVFAGIILCLIYQYYYKGAGDTLLYYHGSSVMKDLFFKDYLKCIKFIFAPLTEESINNAFSYDDETPIYLGDSHAFAVVQMLLPINIIGLDSFIPMTIILAAISFTGIWKLYEVFISEFPNIKGELAFAILFIPSVVFWGSGLLKDSITICAVGWYTNGFYFGVIKKRKILKNVINLILAALIIIAIKPYILFALIPGSTIWAFISLSANIKNAIIRVGSGFFFMVISIAVSYLILVKMGDELGAYSLDKVMTKAVTTQLDLKKDYYEGNSFDIGTFDGSFKSVLAVAPLAINAALFRPYLWEAKNVVMLISGLENLIILWITLFLLVRLKFFGFFRYIGKNQLLLFSMLFALFFAFSVGVSISNFGALVRLKIPCIPFYVASVFVIRDYYIKNKTKISKEKFWKV